MICKDYDDIQIAFILHTYALRVFTLLALVKLVLIEIKCLIKVYAVSNASRQNLVFCVFWFCVIWTTSSYASYFKLRPRLAVCRQTLLQLLATERTWLMVCFWGGPAEPFRSLMPFWPAGENMEDYINLALQVSDYAYPGCSLRGGGVCFQLPRSRRRGPLKSPPWWQWALTIPLRQRFRKLQTRRRLLSCRPWTPYQAFSSLKTHYLHWLAHRIIHKMPHLPLYFVLSLWFQCGKNLKALQCLYLLIFLSIINSCW